MAADPWRNPAEAAYRDEWRRLNELATALLAVRVDATADAEAIAARQDRNLEMFEAMTARVGGSALTQLRRLLEALEELRSGDSNVPAEDVAEKLRAATREMSAERDAEMRALIATLGGQAGRPVDNDEPVWEPFEG